MQKDEPELVAFLKKSNLSMDDWANSGFEWMELQNIGRDYESKRPSLDGVSEFIAKTLQVCPQVHSVRWRVKDVDHLLAKLVRKRALGKKKYLDVSVENYVQKVTDLVGIRVLHLFKGEWEQIDSFIQSKWSMHEPAVAYIREGDDQSDYEKKIDDIQNHPAGYRSIHYLVESSATIEKVISEIQVRTLFEEGWSEIDHRVRYPNFSDNPLLAYFLNIFNRMSGSADEMGSFVNDLTLHIAESEKMVSLANAQRDEHIEKIELLVSELEAEKSLSSEMQDKLKAVNKELSSLRPAQNLSSGYDLLSHMAIDYEKLLGVTNLNQTYNELFGISDVAEKAMQQLSLNPNISSLESLLNITPSIYSNNYLDTVVKPLTQEVDSSEQTMKKNPKDS